MTRNLPVKADPIRAYLHQIGQFPVLTPDEERELARRWYDEHDIEAARRLVVANLRFVVTVARQYHGYGLRPMDLIQEGNLGLMVAVKRFNPHRNLRLISYAVFWIRAYILNFVMRSWRLVRLGTTRAQRKLFYKIRTVQRQLRQLDRVVVWGLPVWQLDLARVREVPQDVDLVLALRVGDLRGVERLPGDRNLLARGRPGQQGQEQYAQSRESREAVHRTGACECGRAETIPSSTSDATRNPARASSAGAAGKPSAGTITSPTRPTVTSRSRIPSAQTARNRSVPIDVMSHHPSGA